MQHGKPPSHVAGAVRSIRRNLKGNPTAEELKIAQVLWSKICKWNAVPWALIELTVREQIVLGLLSPVSAVVRGLVSPREAEVLGYMSRTAAEALAPKKK